MDPAEIRALDRILERLDYYRLLKLEHDAAASEVRRAYHRARQRFDPDSCLAQDEAVREAVDRIARRITEGYLVLRDRRRRRAYDEALQAGTLRLPPDRADEAQAQREDRAEGTTPNGRRFVALAREEERRGNLKQAFNHLQMALTWERDNEALQSHLAELKSRL